MTKTQDDPNKDKGEETSPNTIEFSKIPSSTQSEENKEEKQPTITQNPDQNNYQKLLYFLFQTQLPRNGFIQGTQPFFRYCWPIIFYILLFCDIHRYRTETDVRYTNSYRKIFIGEWDTVANQNNTLTNLSRNPGWIFGFLISTPLFLGFYELVRQQWFEKKTKNSELMPLLEKAESSSAFLKCIVWFFPSVILDIFKIFFCRWPKLVDAIQCARIRQQEIDVEKLKNTKGISSIYTYYLLWGLGKLKIRKSSRNVGWHSLFWLMNLPFFYALTRYALSIAEYITVQAMQMIDKNNCTEKWTYLPESGRHECTVCGDWPRMPYRAVFSLKDCVNTLLKIPRPIEEILNALNSLGSQYNNQITTYDFTQQYWRDLDIKTWEQLLTKMEALSKKPLETFNVSTRSEEPLDPILATAFQQFLLKTQTQQFNISHHFLAPNLSTLLQNNTFLTHIDLTNTLKENSTLHSIVNSFAHLTQLHTLQLSQNHLSDADIYSLSTVISNLSLQHLDISYNNFGAQGYAALLHHFPATLTQLSLSGNDLSQANFTLFKPILAQIPVRQLTFSNSQLGDIQLTQLAPALNNSQGLQIDLSSNELTFLGVRALSESVRTANISALFLSGNQLDSQSLVLLTQSLVNTSTMTTLDVGRNVITDQGLIVFSSLLPYTPLKVLYLNNNPITSVGITALVGGLQRASLDALSLGNNYLQNEGIASLSQAWAYANQTLKYVDLTNNGVTEKGLNVFLQNIRDRHRIHTLVLNNNFLGAAENPNEIFNNLLAKNNFTSIHLDDCQLDSSAANAIARVLPHSVVNEILLRNNLLNNSGIVAIARQLITPLPQPKTLTAQDLTPNQKQAILSAKPNTCVRRIDLTNTQCDTIAAYAFCRVVAPAQLNCFDIQNNLINPEHVQPTTCWYSSDTSRHRPPYFIQLIYSITVRTPSTLLQLSILNSRQNGIRLTENRIHTEFFSVLTTVIQEQPMIAPWCYHIGTHLLAILLAFQEEFLNRAYPYLPIGLTTYFTQSETQFFREIAGFAVRSAYSGTPTLTYDITRTVKNVYQVQSSRRQFSNKTHQPTSFTYELSKGLLFLLSVYAISFATENFTASAWSGYFLLLILFHSKKIARSTKTAYQQHGFFAAVETAIEEVAFTAPGGNYLRQDRH